MMSSIGSSGEAVQASVGSWTRNNGWSRATAPIQAGCSSKPGTTRMDSWQPGPLPPTVHLSKNNGAHQASGSAFCRSRATDQARLPVCMEGSFYGASQNMTITSMPFGPDSISSAGCHGGFGADTMNERSGNAMKNFNCVTWSTMIRIGRWSCLVTYRKGDMVDDPSLCADLGTSRTAHNAACTFMEHEPCSPVPWRTTTDGLQCRCITQLRRMFPIAPADLRSMVLLLITGLSP